MRKILAGLTLVGLLLWLSACNKAEEFEHVEAFIIETMSETVDNNGLFVPTGYKKVNSVSYIKERNDKVKAETSEIEDYYDLNGEYIKTTVTYSHGEHKKLHNVMHGEKKPMELDEPTTIMLPDDFTHIFTKTLTEEDEEQLKKHVFEYVEGLK